MNDLATVTGLPLNDGTLARRNTLATQLPTLVPWNAPPITWTPVTRPLVANVTRALPEPFGPSKRRQAVHCDATIAFPFLAKAAVDYKRRNASRT